MKDFLVDIGDCRVLKVWHLNTHPHQYGMGKCRRNRVLKLTSAKVKYIIRAKINNISSIIIAAEMKVSIRTINRVWGHWMRASMKNTIYRPQKMLFDRDYRKNAS